MPTAVDQYNYIMHNIMFEGTLLIVPPEPNMHIAILPCIYDMVCCNCALQAIEVYSIQLHKLKTLFINPHLVDLHTYSTYIQGILGMQRMSSTEFRRALQIIQSELGV